MPTFTTTTETDAEGTVTLKLKPAQPQPDVPHRYVGYAEMFMRLEGTIIRYRGRPVIAHCQESNTEYFGLKLIDVITKKTHKTTADDPDIVLASPPLGYMNPPENEWKAGSKFHPLYVCRAADRLQQQGLSPKQLRFYSPDGTVHTGSSLPYNLLGETILGTYPAYPVARTAVLTDKLNGLAFHRRFAIIRVKGVPLLFARGQALGVMDLKTDTLHIRSAIKDLPVLQQVKEWVNFHV